MKRIVSVVAVVALVAGSVALGAKNWRVVIGAMIILGITGIIMLIRRRKENREQVTAERTKTEKRLKVIFIGFIIIALIFFVGSLAYGILRGFNLIVLSMMAISTILFILNLIVIRKLKSRKEGEEINEPAGEWQGLNVAAIDPKRATKTCKKLGMFS